MGFQSGCSCLPGRETARQERERETYPPEGNPPAKDESSLMQHTTMQTNHQDKPTGQPSGVQQSKGAQQPSQANKTAREHKPAAAKSKPARQKQDSCQPRPPQQQQSSSSSQDTWMPTHNTTHFPLILSQQPPFTALQHGLPVLRDMLSYQLHASTSPPPHPPQAMAAPPPPQPTREELELTLQIAQTLTTHIQDLARKIMQSHHHNPTSNQPHHNDVITIDSQESHTQEQATTTEQATPHDPTTAQAMTRTTQPTAPPQAQYKPDGGLQPQKTPQTTTQSRPGQVPGQEGPPEQAPPTETAGTATPPHTSQPAEAATQHTGSGSHEATNQPWWILGRQVQRSRSPPERRQVDIFADPLIEPTQRMTQYDAGDGTSDILPIAEKDE